MQHLPKLTKIKGAYDSGHMSKVLKTAFPALDEEVSEQLDALNHEQMMAGAESSYLSSWYSGETEIHKMWEEYGANGVALVTDKTTLIRELPDPLRAATSFYRLVYDDTIKSIEWNEPLRIKNEQFLSENEFRLVIYMHRYSILTGFENEIFGTVFIGDTPTYECTEIVCCMPSEGATRNGDAIRKKGDGYVIAFNLERLVKEIRLHPDCTKENERRVREKVTEAGFNISVSPSSLCETAE